MLSQSICSYNTEFPTYLLAMYCTTSYNFWHRRKMSNRLLRTFECIPQRLLRRLPHSCRHGILGNIFSSRTSSRNHQIGILGCNFHYCYDTLQNIFYHSTVENTFDFAHRSVCNHPRHISENTFLPLRSSENGYPFGYILPDVYTSRMTVGNYA